MRSASRSADSPGIAVTNWGREKTRVLFFAVGAKDIFVHVKLRKKPRIKTDLYLRFEDLLVKGRGAGGNVVTRHRVSSVRGISEGVYRNRLEAGH